MAPMRLGHFNAKEIVNELACITQPCISFYCWRLKEGNCGFADVVLKKVHQEFPMFLGWSHSNFWGTSKTCNFSSPATRYFISNMARSSQQLMEIFIHNDSRKHIPLQKECNTWYGCSMEICSCKNYSHWKTMN